LPRDLLIFKRSRGKLAPTKGLHVFAGQIL
jgi:hypothetical protein